MRYVAFTPYVPGDDYAQPIVFRSPDDSPFDLAAAGYADWSAEFTPDDGGSTVMLAVDDSQASSGVIVISEPDLDVGAGWLMLRVTAPSDFTWLGGPLRPDSNARPA